MLVSTDLAVTSMPQGTKHAGVEHTTVQGVGHFCQDGGAEQLLAAIIKLIAATPADAIGKLEATPKGM
eukprot:SAG31_NODE_23062_length_512_cov_0.878935_1_plen_68_part_00